MVLTIHLLGLVINDNDTICISFFFLTGPIVASNIMSCRHFKFLIKKYQPVQAAKHKRSLTIMHPSPCAPLEYVRCQHMDKKHLFCACSKTYSPRKNITTNVCLYIWIYMHDIAVPTKGLCSGYHIFQVPRRTYLGTSSDIRQYQDNQRYLGSI